ncbi:MAG: DUF1592 domain-containing protein [Myxococcota bacterium]|nr:DUF1592 domain-containing protein [Myxococcota bacterium]
MDCSSRTETRRHRAALALVGAAAALFGLSACEGLIESPLAGPRGSTRTDERTPLVCGEGRISAGRGLLRRLTPREYTSTVRALLADPAASPALSTDTGEVISLLEVDELHVSAEQLAARDAERTEPLYPCDVSGAIDDACAHTLIADFGRRAFRRPLTVEEITWLRGVYDRARAELASVSSAPEADAMSVVVQVILQSPQLLYVHEHGVVDPTLPADVRRLDGYERATRLSFFLWGETPDDALLDAAEAGELDTPDGVRANAQRLLMDERAQANVVRFFVDWLELDGTTLHQSLEENPKSPERFPIDGPELRTAMRREIEALVSRVFFEDDASFQTLMTTRDAYVNGSLATLYGVEGGPSDDATYAWVELDPAERAGLFTRAAFLSLYSGGDVQSPIRRGVFLLENVLCNELGEPPPNASDVPITGGASDGSRTVLSVREHVDARTIEAGGVCAGCHSVINPAGFTLERYDALGGYQLEEVHLDADGREVRLPVDSSGQLVGSDVEGALADGVALADGLATSRRARDCLAERFVTTALGRHPSSEDACAVERVQERFAETDDMRELVLGIVTSDAFLYIRSEEE